MNALAQGVCIRKLIQLSNNYVGKEDVLQEQLFSCMDKVMVCSKKEPSVERTVKFFSAFLASAGETLFFKGGIEYLILRSQASEKTVRYRACQIIASTMDSMSEDAEVAEDLCVSLINAMVPRLRDKAPNVRLSAVYAVKRFQDRSEDNIEKDPITKELIRLMSSDSSKDIRIAAIEVFNPTKKTLANLVDRIKDIKSEVRIAAYEALTKVANIRNFKGSSIKSQIVRYGLYDRDENVRKSASKLIMKWLNDLDNNMPRLLYSLNLERYEDEAQIVAHTIISEYEKSERSAFSAALRKELRDNHPKWSELSGEVYVYYFQLVSSAYELSYN